MESDNGSIIDPDIGSQRFKLGSDFGELPALTTDLSWGIVLFYSD